MKHLLSPEQSATLIAKGISVDKASYNQCTTPIGNGVRGVVRTPVQPIFTLADLLGLIPKTIPDEDNKPNGYHRFGIAVDHAGLWCVSYFGNCYRHVGFDNKEMIDSLYQMVMWLADEKLIDLTK